MTLTQKLALPNAYLQVQQQLSDIEAIDYFFAKEVSQALLISNTAKLKLNEIQQKQLFYLFIVLSAYVRAGHSCLPIKTIAGQCWGSAQDESGQNTHTGFVFPEFSVLQQLLIQLPINCSEQEILVFEDNKLYMRRYYSFESELIQGIHARLAPVQQPSIDDVRHCMNILFPTSSSSESEIDWQKIAVANAINKNFSVIAGGPGTGKTFTVTKLLAALFMLAKKSDSHNPLAIALVAPTGKAAQRLTESIKKAIKGFTGVIDKNILAEIPTKAKTIHRLLGVIPNSPNFRHHQDNLLDYDVLLIDEVSMVDLPMMTRIFRALKPTTKVILLGDADQLPSVAVGSVLADIAPRPHNGYSKSNYHYLDKVCEIEEEKLSKAFDSSTENVNDYLSFLVKSRRFDGEGGIGILASYVINSDVAQSWQLLSEHQGVSPVSDAQLSLVNSDLKTWLTPLVKQYYQEMSACQSIDEAFKLLAKFRVLCVTRQGDYGVEAINNLIQELIVGSSSFSQANKKYHGMPIMISENDYKLGLFNGDIGILWSVDPINDRNSNHLMAFFEDTAPENNVQNDKHIPQDKHTMAAFKSFLPSRLPKYETVYAMTIHKTQGSEFAHVAMVLPKSDSPLLSRELLYTGITRAQNFLTVATNQYAWQQGVSRAVKRYSGLKLT